MSTEKTEKKIAKPAMKPTGFRIDEQRLAQIHALMVNEGSRSLQQFCERAVDFYIGYLTSENRDGYLAQVIESELRGLFSQFESDMRREQTRLSVNMAELMLAQMLTTEYTQDELHRIRAKAWEMVRSDGYRSLEKAQKEAFEIMAQTAQPNDTVY